MIARRSGMTIVDPLPEDDELLGVITTAVDELTVSGDVLLPMLGGASARSVAPDLADTAFELRLATEIGGRWTPESQDRLAAALDAVLKSCREIATPAGRG